MKFILWFSFIFTVIFGVFHDDTNDRPETVRAELAPVATSETFVRFAAIGDYGVNSSDEAAVASLVASWNPNFVVTTGDNNYSDGAASTIDKNIGKYYHQFIFPYTGSFGAGASENLFFPVLGNHDWNGLKVANNSATGPYLDYFALPGNERYYDFVRGPVHFFMVDSDDREPDGIKQDSVQAQWLQTQLRQSTARWQLVLLHHPPYSSGQHGSETALQWPYRDWGADLVLAGHDHNYERLEVNGLPYVVNGLGGASLRAFASTVIGSKVRYKDNHGAMLIEASTITLTLKTIAIDDQLIDEFSLPDGQPGTTPTAIPTAPALNKKAYLPYVQK